MYRDYFVTADWLHTHLNDDNLVVLDVSKAPPGQPADCHQLWLERHIPGAHYFDLDKVADLSSPLPHMLPSPEVFAQAAGEFGIDNDTMVIIYDQGNLFSAPRAWWTLKTFGVKNLRILQGGLNAWAGAGYTTESGELPLPQAKTFVP
ncbi:MAG: rhodanese-like domain-containing protein, partial [Morganella morganii]